MKIIKLTPSQHKEGRWLVWLESGDLLRVSQNEVADFGLYQDMELDAETLARLESAAETSAMKNKALDALSSRPMSRRELVNKLTVKPRRSRSENDDSSLTDDESLHTRAESVADRLEELGLLNDESYAVQVAKHYAAKGYGTHKVRDELFRRGVPREYWDVALESLDDPAPFLDAFLEKKLRGKESDRAELKRAADALARRGFFWEDVSAALARRGEYSED